MRNTIILFFLIGKLISQVNVNPTSTIACGALYSSAHFTIVTGVLPYSFTVQTPGCATTFTSVNNSATPSFTLGCSGTYTFLIKDALNTDLGSFTHTVSLANTFTVNINNNYNDSICLGTYVTMYLDDGQLAPGTGLSYTINSYNWSSGDTGNTTTISPTITTAYSVTALFTTSMSRTCTIDAYKTIYVFQSTYWCTAIGLKEQTNDSPIRVYPNPFHKSIFIEADNLEKISITNLTGQKVYEMINPLSGQEIDLSFLPKGLYFFRSDGKTMQNISKIIKE